MSAPSHKRILLFGMVNAALFCALQPLWEGFDEPFHYGYVETLWQTGRLPVLGRTLLPKDVFASFPLAPVSHAVHAWIPETTDYHDWFALPEAEKVRRRDQLYRLRPEPGAGARPNHEAHQTPMSAWLAAGLLAKAYVLAFAVLAAGVAVMLLARRRMAARALVPGAALILAIAGPWYARNVVLYGNLAGTHEAFDGIGLRETLAAAPRIDWPCGGMIWAPDS